MLIATKFNNSKTLGEIGFVVIWTSDGHTMNGELVPFKRVSMGLTDRRKTAKNLVDSRKN